MPTIRFTANLQRHVECPDREVAGVTVAEVLESFFAENPQVRGYILDEQGKVRHHVVIFNGGTPIRDRATQTDPVAADGEVYVFQALSGG